MNVRPCIAASLGAVAIAFSVPATAAPATANSIQLGLGFRYGFDLNDNDIDPWRTGLGANAGITLPNALYVGADFDYFFGQTQQVLGTDVSAHLWQLMAEGGYDLGVGPLVLRPKLGVGVAHVTMDGCAPPIICYEPSSTRVALAPGATFLLLTSSVKLTLDLRYDVVMTDPGNVKAIVLSAGVGF